ncbi:MAG TPA: hypothetical protein VK530_00055, partial [Candidatus Acidoferrum sp.]|nr:hypothetical protein [Candidatus Acidoferrum sp.]
HAAMEVARNILGHHNAAHEELEPTAAFPVVSRLACSLVERSESIVPVTGSRFANWYGAPREEGFHCSFGLNPQYERLLAGAGLAVVARSDAGEPRAIEWEHARFFVGTLFQPERAALHGEIHPLIRAFLKQ